MHQEDAHQAAPDERGHGAGHGSSERPTGEKRDGEAAERPDRKQSGHDAEVSILEEIDRESLLVRSLGAKQPTDVRVEQTSEARAPSCVVRRLVIATLREGECGSPA